MCSIALINRLIACDYLVLCSLYRPHLTGSLCKPVDWKFYFKTDYQLRQLKNTKGEFPKNNLKSAVVKIEGTSRGTANGFHSFLAEKLSHL